MNHVLNPWDRTRRGIFSGMILLLAFLWNIHDLSAADRPHVALIAGSITGHPKDAHEYEKAVTLIKHCLETSPNAPDLAISAHYHGWPSDPSVLDQADVIMLVSDGSDQGEGMHPFYRDDRFQVLKKQMERGCGLMTLHWSTFHPARHHDEITEWVGEYFDYETGTGPRKWFSKIQTWEDTVQFPNSDHPVLNGVNPFRLKDEYYYNIRFREADHRLTSLVEVVPPGGAKPDTVAWAIERDHGSRGLGFTGGHFHDSWWIPGFRKMLLNAVVWMAGEDVPSEGIQSNLSPRLKVMILTGDNHPAHDWKKTSAALMHAIELDPRNVVHVTETPEQWLSDHDPEEYDLLVMNYCNWESPGWSEVAKEKLTAFVRRGGGFAVIHFGNGAFHRSLPDAADSDWPVYRQLVRRVWDHQGDSGHDRYGPFKVHMTQVSHPITEGLLAFDTQDELYFAQAGETPVQALAFAESKVTGRAEPMAWAYTFGNGRVFQTLLGHSDESIQKAANLIQRGCTWAARQFPLTFDPPVSITEKAIFRNGSQWKPE